jgi:alkanesulfonate monooxygenase
LQPKRPVRRPAHEHRILHPPALHGETQFLPGDPRNRGDWHAGGPSTGAVSGFAVGDHFTYIDYLGQIARAAEINGFGGALMVNAPTGEEPWTVCSLLARKPAR